MPALYGEKQNFLGIAFSQLPHVQHTTVSQGSSNPWAGHPVKAGTALNDPVSLAQCKILAQCSLRSWKV